MRLPLHDSSSRRAILTALAALPMPLLPLPSVADGRTVAQSVGIDNKETLSGAVGIIWGGRERCDPTDDTCQAGGTDGAAAEALAVPQPRSAVTDRFALDLVIAGQAAGRITLGLYRDAAPASSDTLLQLARGELRSDPDDVPATLERSNLVRVLKDREVVLGSLKVPNGQLRLMSGKTRPQRFPVVPPSNDDANDLSHDAAGLLSVRRGGGSFEFMLTPAPNAKLDKEWLVIGQIVEPEGMQVLARLNSLPTNNYDQTPIVLVKVERAVPLPGGGTPGKA
jgi:cyclophilin family peptidyl-prolyl cis-trans isomerase